MGEGQPLLKLSFHELGSLESLTMGSELPSFLSFLSSLLTLSLFCLFLFLSHFFLLSSTL